MNFLSNEFLLTHIQSILNFYEKNILHPLGGYHHNYKDDGSIFNPDFRHLVSSCRLIYNYCKAWELFKKTEYLELAQKGWDFLENVHYDKERCAYNWTINGLSPLDQTNHCYGLAFVILAHSAAHLAGIPGAKDSLYKTFQIMEKYFWQKDSQLYADEATADWKIISSYRGQNANMHTCEACLAAYEATKDKMFLDRAEQLAQTISVKLADKAGGLIWEHYHQDLTIDWNFNKDDPKNLYRPWGFQPGHQTEWTKLLLILHSFKPENWMIERARELFDKAFEVAWDKKWGGILYGFSPNKEICDSDKYFWVQAESLAAAAHLWQVTKNEKYLEKYNMIWEYSWNFMIDHCFGAWFRVLTQENKPYSDEKSTAGGKCDYHTLGACYHVLKFGLR